MLDTLILLGRSRPSVLLSAQLRNIFPNNQQITSGRGFGFLTAEASMSGRVGFNQRVSAHSALFRNPHRYLPAG